MLQNTCRFSSARITVLVHFCDGWGHDGSDGSTHFAGWLQGARILPDGCRGHSPAQPELFATRQFKVDESGVKASTWVPHVRLQLGGADDPQLGLLVQGVHQRSEVPYADAVQVQRCQASGEEEVRIRHLYAVTAAIVVVRRNDLRWRMWAWRVIAKRW